MTTETGGEDTAEGGAQDDHEEVSALRPVMVKTGVGELAYTRAHTYPPLLINTKLHCRLRLDGTFTG